MSTDLPPSCGPCMRANVQSEDFSWCSDCEEILCYLCDRAHKIAKPSRSHHIIETTTFKGIPDKLPDFETCSVHPGKNLEGYCSFHDSMCCRSCMVDQHKTCERIDSVDDVSKNVKSSALVEEMSKSLSTLLQTFEDFKENRQNNIRDVQEIIPILKLAVGDLRANAVEHMNNLETSLCKELDNLGENIAAELELELDKVDTMANTISNCKENLEFSIEYMSNRKILLMLAKLKEMIDGSETTTEEVISKSRDFKINLKKSEKLIEMIESVTSINVERTHCSVTFHKSVKVSSQVAPSQIKFGETSEICLPEICTISAIDITHGDIILLCDYFNCKVVVFTKDNTHLKDVNLDGKPFGITSRGNENEAFITMPGQNIITVINVIKMQKERSFKTTRKYYGITSMKDVVAVGATGQIDILSLNGDCNRTLKLPGSYTENVSDTLMNKFDVRFLHFSQSEFIICSNRMGVYCINLLDGRIIFNYSDAEEPRGVTSDKYGHIYVADKAQNVVQKLYPNGEILDILCNEKDYFNNCSMLQSRCFEVLCNT